MIVKFHVADEFIEELKKEPLAKPVVRLTFLRRANERIAPLSALYIVAMTKAADGDLIKLEHYCGALWEIGPEDEKTHQHGEEIYKYVESHCIQLNLEIRSGILEEIVSSGKV